MKTKIKIQNLGKIKDANITLGNLTLLGGANNTGKGFVSKTLYSIFRSLELNCFDTILSTTISSIKDKVKKSNKIPDKSVKTVRKDIFNKLTRIEVICKQDKVFLFNINLKLFENKIIEIKKIINSINLDDIKLLDKFYCQCYLTNRVERTILKDYKKLVLLSKLSSSKYISNAYEATLQSQIEDNFCIGNIHNLAQDNKRLINIAINNELSISINKKSHIKINPKNDLLGLNNKFTDIYYLESLSVWRPTFYEDYCGISSKPYYLRELKETINGKKSKNGKIDPTIKKLINRLYKVIGGKFKCYNNTFYFVEEKLGEFDIDQVSSGIIQLGMLGYWLENNQIGKNSLLFIDEPENSLHPEFLIILSSLLVNLVNNGVSIVMSTHSNDILKYLQVYMETHPEFENLVAINHFTHEGVNVDQRPKIIRQLNEIQRDVSTPYADLFDGVLSVLI